MACYDCEDCGFHEQNGGICKRWEYDCPFSHLPGYSGNNDEIQDKSFLAAINLKKELREIYEKYNKLIEYNRYEYGIESIEHAINKLEESLDKDLLEEFRKIRFDKFHEERMKEIIKKLEKDPIKIDPNAVVSNSGFENFLHNINDNWHKIKKDK